uniref:Uncharacterized protein n=1 Tax=Arundo donax TaxID=35708 RepID=A0A0A9GCD8_ARUDO
MYPTQEALMKLIVLEEMMKLILLRKIMNLTVLKKIGPDINKSQ